MADVKANIKDWSATEANNLPIGTTTVGTGLDDNLRQIQATVVQDLNSIGADIASAATTDLGAVSGLAHTITGTTTISSFGTVRAGVLKIIRLASNLTLTYNATSMILPGGADLALRTGDRTILLSLGSGNWLVVGVEYATAVVTNAGIKFSPTQVASTDANTLDDYEEGTWTPASNGTATYTTQVGKYIKIGRLVCVQGHLVVNTIGTGDQTAIYGLPFLTDSGERQVGCVSRFSSIGVSATFVGLSTDISASTMPFHGLTVASNSTSALNVLNNNADVFFSMAYFTNQ